MKEMTIAFVRVSNENVQDTQAQKQAINDYCIKHDIKIDKWIEEKISGYKTKIEDRVGLQEIKDLCLRTDVKIKRLIIFNSDRLGRRMELVAFMSLLSECGVSVISVTEGELNSGLDTDDLMASIKFWMASNESKKISKRIASGKKANWKDDVYVGGKLALGYKVENKRVVIDEQYKDIVKNIFNIYINQGSNKCLDYLNSLGLKNLNGNIYTRQSIVGMIKNKNYIGFRMSQAYNEEIYVEDLRIIDDYTFYKANAILKNRTRKQGSTLKYTNRNEDNKYEGLIFHKCPDNKISKFHMSYTYPNENRYANLICNNCKDHRYKVKRTYGIISLYKKLDKEVDNILSSLNSDKIETELYKKKDCIIHNLESEIKIKKEKLKEDNKLLEGLNETLDKIFKGEIKFDLQQILDRVSETQSKIVEQEKSIKQLEEELKIEKSKEENQHKLLDKFKNFKNIYDIGTDEQKKMALRELVDRIIIDTNDNITIELKYIEV